MEKKTLSISLCTFLIFILILIAFVLAFYISVDKKANNSVAENQTTNTSTASTPSSDSTSDNSNSAEEPEISYITLEVLDPNSTQGISYISKKLTDQTEIQKLMDIIDSATTYEKEPTSPDLGDAPPVANIYFSDDTHFSIAAADGMIEDGQSINFMTKWTSDDGNDKELYSVEQELAKYISDLFEKIN